MRGRMTLNIAHYLFRINKKSGNDGQYLTTYTFLKKGSREKILSTSRGDRAIPAYRDTPHTGSVCKQPHIVQTRYVVLQSITLDYKPPRCTTIHYGRVTLYYNPLQWYIVLQSITSHYKRTTNALRCTTIHYIVAHCTTIHYIPLHPMTSHYIVLHCITL